MQNIKSSIKDIYKRSDFKELFRILKNGSNKKRISKIKRSHRQLIKH